MKKPLSLLLLLVCLSITYAQNQTYTILAGDTVYSLARKNNITVEQLYNANPGIKENGLKLKQVIIIPSNGSKSSNSSSSNTYTVVPGDTLYSLLKKYNLSQKQFSALNPGVTAENLQVGQVLKISSNPEKIVLTNAESIKPIVATPAKPRDNDGFINVAYILPFNAKNTQANKVKRDITTDFYLGSLFALDSLSNNGYKIKVKVYDNNGTLADTKSIVSKNDFSNTDLIIGPLSSENAHYVADYFKEENIKIVSPFSSEVSVAGRENLIKTKLEDDAIYKNIFSNIAAYKTENNIYIIGDQDPKLVIKLKEKYPISKILVLSPLSDYDLATLPKKSTIILNTADEKLAKEALTEFNKINILGDEYKANFIAIGYNSVYVKGHGANANFIGNTLLSALGLTVFINNYFNDNEYSVYKTKLDYETKNHSLPNIPSSAGFDVTYYLIKDALYTKPTAKKVAGIYNNFEFKKIEKGGYENVGIFEINY